MKEPNFRWCSHVSLVSCIVHFHLEELLRLGNIQNRVLTDENGDGNENGQKAIGLSHGLVHVLARKAIQDQGRI